VRPLRITLTGEVETPIPADNSAVSLRKDGSTTPAGTAGSSAVGQPADVEIRPLAVPEVERAAGQRLFEVTVDGWILRYRVEDEERAALLERARRGGSSAKAHTREHVRARIPGRVTRIWVEPGQEVVAGERLLALEAMKMENEVRAPRAGTVASIHVQPGQPVELNTELITLD
jgi:biotin carboxyl carrier protein